jgi:hypothetical protein
MLKRTVIILVSLIFAVLCTAVAHISYMSVAVIWLDRVHFFNYHYPLAHLLCAGAALGIAIVILLRARSIASLLFLAGVIGLFCGTVYDCLISWGMDYHWFRGFFRLEEHPVVAFTVHTFEVVFLLTYIGIFWISLRFARRHLTMRWRQAMPGCKYFRLHF